VNFLRIYGVLNIDIVNSRGLTNRIEIQENLKKYIKELNDEYKELLVSYITFTLGDEIQIVLNKAEESYNIFKKFQAYLLNENIKCYGGLGIGTIDTKISKDSREMDGKAFIYAREAINIAKDRNRFYNKYLNSKENRVLFRGEEVYLNKVNNDNSLREVAVTSTYNPEDILILNRVINTLIENNEVIEEKFTEKQREVIYLYEKYGSYSSIVDNVPEFSKASISQKLNTSNYFLTIHNKSMIRELLKTYIVKLKENLNEF
jgi:hypothetical protein